MRVRDTLRRVSIVSGVSAIAAAILLGLIMAIVTIGTSDQTALGEEAQFKAETYKVDSSLEDDQPKDAQPKELELANTQKQLGQLEAEESTAFQSYNNVRREMELKQQEIAQAVADLVLGSQQLAETQPNELEAEIDELEAQVTDQEKRYESVKAEKQAYLDSLPSELINQVQVEQEPRVEEAGLQQYDTSKVVPDDQQQEAVLVEEPEEIVEEPEESGPLAAAGTLVAEAVSLIETTRPVNEDDPAALKTAPVEVEASADQYQEPEPVGASEDQYPEDTTTENLQLSSETETQEVSKAPEVLSRVPEPVEEDGPPNLDPAPQPTPAATGDVAIHGGPVAPHVQEFADAVCREFGACTISTYAGHQPAPELALDVLVAERYGIVPDSTALGDAVANFAVNNSGAYGIDYVIWGNRIAGSWNGYQWEKYGGSGATDGHYDHVHVGFFPSR